MGTEHNRHEASSTMVGFHDVFASPFTFHAAGMQKHSLPGMTREALVCVSVQNEAATLSNNSSCDAAKACSAVSKQDSSCFVAKACSAVPTPDSSCDAAKACSAVPTPASPYDVAKACSAVSKPGSSCDAAKACSAVPTPASPYDVAKACSAVSKPGSSCDAAKACRAVPTPDSSCDAAKACSAVPTPASPYDVAKACSAVSKPGSSCDVAKVCRAVPTPDSSCDVAKACSVVSTPDLSCGVAKACSVVPTPDSSCDAAKACRAVPTPDSSCDVAKACSVVPTPDLSCGVAKACSVVPTPDSSCDAASTLDCGGHHRLCGSSRWLYAGRSQLAHLMSTTHDVCSALTTVKKPDEGFSLYRLRSVSGPRPFSGENVTCAPFLDMAGLQDVLPQHNDPRLLLSPSSPICHTYDRLASVSSNISLVQLTRAVNSVSTKQAVSIAGQIVVPAGFSGIERNVVSDTPQVSGHKSSGHPLLTRECVQSAVCHESPACGGKDTDLGLGVDVDKVIWSVPPTPLPPPSPCVVAGNYGGSRHCVECPEQASLLMQPGIIPGVTMTSMGRGCLAEMSAARRVGHYSSSSCQRPPNTVMSVLRSSQLNNKLSFGRGLLTNRC